MVTAGAEVFRERRPAKIPSTCDEDPHLDLDFCSAEATRSDLHRFRKAGSIGS
jgi:hypothetical protein